MSDQGSESGGYSPVRGPKPVRGPSGNALGWLRGLGLLSVLVVIGVMALLTSKVLSDTGGDEVQIVRGDVTSSVPLTAAGVDGAPLGDGSRDVGEVAACETDRRTVALAAEAYEIEHGVPPADVQALVDAEYLKPGLDLQVVIAADGTVVSTGTCAGG